MFWKLARVLEVSSCSGSWFVFWKLVRVLEVGSSSGSWFVFWKLVRVLEVCLCSGSWAVFWKFACVLEDCLCSGSYPMTFHSPLQHVTNQCRSHFSSRLFSNMGKTNKIQPKECPNKIPWSRRARHGQSDEGHEMISNERHERLSEDNEGHEATAMKRGGNEGHEATGNEGQ